MQRCGVGCIEGQTRKYAHVALLNLIICLCRLCLLQEADDPFLTCLAGWAAWVSQPIADTLCDWGALSWLREDSVVVLR